MTLNTYKIRYANVEGYLYSTMAFVSRDQKMYHIKISLDPKVLYILESNVVAYQKAGKDLKQLKREAKRVLKEVFKVQFKDIVTLEGRV